MTKPLESGVGIYEDQTKNEAAESPAAFFSRTESPLSRFGRYQRRLGLGADRERHGSQNQHQQRGDESQAGRAVKHGVPVVELLEEESSDSAGENGGHAFRHIKEAVVGGGVVGAVVVADDRREEREHAAPDEV